MNLSQARFLDVWIVETNTVYKEVPYTVVSDWVQQGRLLEDDRVKPSGTRDWVALGQTPDLVPFLPRPEPFRAEDQAEALEPVGLDFTYRRPSDEEDDDPDMIPLIDVSLVLLVFFMLTASAATAATISRIATPETEYGLVTDADQAKVVRIDVHKEGKDTPVYSVALGDRPAEEDDTDLRTLAKTMEHLKARLARIQGKVDVVINVDKDLRARVARDILLALRAEPFRSKIDKPYFGVSDVSER